MEPIPVQNHHHQVNIANEVEQDLENVQFLKHNRDSETKQKNFTEQ